MGVKGSASKKKSSKKKRNKISSQVLKKKKSKRKELKRRVNSEYASSSSESDYKRRKIKSKKRNPAYSTSDDGSVSPNSDSSSTCDSYRRRKAQHKSQIASKSRQKRSLKRHSSHVDDTGSRKRKRSRLAKDHVVKSRKKVLKKSRKHFSESSSSDTESCPQCLGGSSSTRSSSDGEHQRGRVQLDKEIERSKRREIHRDHKPRRIQSPSSSPCSRGIDHVISVDHSTAALTVVNNSRRLKSVIYVVNQHYDENENRFEIDPYKEEMVCDQNDYPSPKSVDSNGGNKKESESASDDKRFYAGNFEDREVRGITECGYDRYSAGDCPMDEVPSNNFAVEREQWASVTVTSLDEDINRDSVGNDDLESILRGKALENLKRFRGGLQTGIINNESNNKSSAQKVDSIQTKSTKEDRFGEQGMDQISKPALKRNFSQLMGAAKESDGEQGVEGYGISKQATAHSPADPPFLEYKEKEGFASAPAVFTNCVSTSNTNEGTGSAFSCKTATEQIPSVQPMSEEPSLKKQQHVTNDGSEFEQKTMTVMRGGEPVQVSYKVYIPKRTPALARRQLRRQ